MPEPCVPTGIPSHTLSVLEFRKVLPEIASRADSALGRELATGVAPARDLAHARELLQALGEWLRLESGDPAPPSLALPDVRESLRRSEAAGAVLDAEELLDVARVARASRLARGVFDARAEDAPALASALAPRLGRFVGFEQAVERAIDERAEVRDEASSVLKKLRRRIESTRAAISERLERWSNRIGAESFVTQRGGRYTVAVPIEWLDRVRGVVHDRSASGATIFLEPFEAVELGNRLREDEEAERAEVRRILAELTTRAGEIAAPLTDSAVALGELDLLRAKGRLFRDWGCVLPELRPGGPIHLRSGRHPLVARARESRGEMVVPLTLALGEGPRILVITGPNMGGKTVALKTLGLLTLMAMAGLGVPAAEGTGLGFFSTIVADIGDEQSIEEDLSTFASHVRNLRDAIETAGAGSLVLLDELGAGTDPAEGAALGQAVLEVLAGSGATAVVTTHHGSLKGMAISNPAISNASMAFEPETHTPLYQLVPGVPGRSLGIEVAERLGFPGSVLARARDLVPAGEHHLGELIADVERRRLALDEERRELVQARSALTAILGKYRSRLAEIRQARDRILSRAEEHAGQVVSEAEELVRAARRTLRLAGSRGGGEARGSSSGPGATDALSPGLGREIESLAEQLRQVHPTPGPEPHRGGAVPDLSAGAMCFAPELGSVVEVIQGPDSGGRVLVRRGAIKLEIHVDRLRPATARDMEADRPVVPRPPSHVEVDAPTSMEIDLRGLTGDEAVAAVERFLEQATVHGLPMIRIIHGKGTGVLKTRIQDLLRSHPRIASFRLGESGEGGAGVTVVEMG